MATNDRTVLLGSLAGLGLLYLFWWNRQAAAAYQPGGRLFSGPLLPPGAGGPAPPLQTGLYQPGDYLPGGRLFVGPMLPPGTDPSPTGAGAPTDPADVPIVGYYPGGYSTGTGATGADSTAGMLGGYGTIDFVPLDDLFT